MFWGTSHHHLSLFFCQEKINDNLYSLSTNAGKDELTLLDPIFIEGKGELWWIFHQHQIDIHQLSLGQENRLMFEQFQFSERFFSKTISTPLYLYSKTFTFSWSVKMKLMWNWQRYIFILNCLAWCFWTFCVFVSLVNYGALLPPSLMLYFNWYICVCVCPYDSVCVFFASVLYIVFAHVFMNE